MKRCIFLISAILLLLIAGLLSAKYYPYLEAAYYNRYIDVSGVKLLMTEEEVEKALSAEGEFVYGMGGYGKRFDDVKVFASISYSGLFAKKVTMIDTENPLHSILGIRTDTHYDNALDILKRRGFKQTGTDIFARGNVHIQLLGGKIRIYITDPAYKDVVW